MSKIISVNAGSSSLKFQLFEMPSEEVLTSGIVEKIGFEDAIFTIKVNGEKLRRYCRFQITQRQSVCCWKRWWSIRL